MGDPKKQRKKYEMPRFPWRTDILQAELSLIGEYGLRNKRELWRHKTMLSRFRGIARSLLGMPPEERSKVESQLLNRLHRIGILPETAELDDVLDLNVEDVLERRLQTVIFRRGLAKSIHQARQFITHGHVAIGEKRIFSPSYLVLKDDEARINYASTSPLNNPDHPAGKAPSFAAETPQVRKVAKKEAGEKELERE